MGISVGSVTCGADATRPPWSAARYRRRARMPTAPRSVRISTVTRRIVEHNHRRRRPGPRRSTSTTTCRAHQLGSPPPSSAKDADLRPPSTPTDQHHDHHLRRYQRHRLRHLPRRRGQHGQLHEGHDAQWQGVRRRRGQHLRLRRRPQRQHHHRRRQGLRTSLRQRRGLRLLHADVLRGRWHLQELHLRLRSTRPASPSSTSCSRTRPCRSSNP